MHPATDHTPGDSTVVGLRVRRLGRRSYEDARALQERAARAVARGADDELLLLEHPPVITLGRGTTPDQLLASRSRLAVEGVCVVASDRGGGATYHGPGQVVGYAIVDLRRRRLGVRSYLRLLEAALIRALQSQGVEAMSRPGLTGVWTPAGKVAAIGIAVRGGITRHGFALNVSADLDAFARIVPCGLQQPVTGLRQLGWKGNRAALYGAIARALSTALRTASADGPRGDVSPRLSHHLHEADARVRSAAGKVALRA